jgi:1-acyl-sn-glycerol-3-phosphate acyltransferase
MHNVPDDGGALVVANHSGTLPLDALMTAVALHDDHPGRRHLRMLGADLHVPVPGVGPLARKHGATLACNPDAERLLSGGELVGVWPEGFKGIGKPFRPLQAAALSAAAASSRPRAHPGADHPVLDRRRRRRIYPKIGDIKARSPACSSRPTSRSRRTFPLLGPARALVPLPSKWLDRVRRAHPHRHDSAMRRRRPDGPSSTSPTRCARRSNTTLYRLLSQRPKTRSSGRWSSIGVMVHAYAHDIDITIRVNGRAVRAVVHPRTTCSTGCARRSGSPAPRRAAATRAPAARAPCSSTARG